ncbi:MAG: hypothetical protein NT029_01830 [Armatimonadetes bacterium]|nr:hypothetical protein [Armatimonadota bacterium]
MRPTSCAGLCALAALLGTAGALRGVALPGRPHPVVHTSAPSALIKPDTARWCLPPLGAGSDGEWRLRRAFRLVAQPKRVRLKVEAAHPVEIRLNGSLACRGSGLTEVELPPANLRVGVNVLTAEVRGGAVGFRVTVETGSGRTADIASGRMERASVAAPPGWSAAEFDDRRWPAVRLGGAWDRPDQAEPAGPVATQPVLSAQPRPTEDAVELPPADLDTGRIIRVWEAGAPPDPTGRRVEPGGRMWQITGMPAVRDLRAVASAGFTTLQTDSDSLSTDERRPAEWDYSTAETESSVARRFGFDWSYFPHFAFPPLWYDRAAFTPIQCLEHGQTVRAFSPWDKRFGAFVQHGYTALGTRFPPSRLQALCVGVHGDGGECGLPAGARLSEPGQRDDWRARFGNLHNHPGWWCADPQARAAFREAMLRKYGSVAGVRTAWRLPRLAEEEIAFPASPAATRTGWLDFVDWYLGSVSSMADSVARVARRAYPATPLMLPAGSGGDDPREGNDLSMVAKVAARHGAAVRSAHGGLYAFARNQATMLGRLASACRFYGAPLILEPPGAVAGDRQVGRIYEAASQGAQGYADLPAGVTASREVYYRYGKHLRAEKRIVDVAMLWPTTSRLLKPGLPGGQVFERGCTAVRDLLDYDTVDERMVSDGALSRYRLLVMWEGPVYGAETLAAIRAWVNEGGVLLAYDFGKVETPDGDQAWHREMLGHGGRLAQARMRPVFDLPAGREMPASYRVQVGDPASSSFLDGDWYPSELVGPATRRWTGAQASVRLPLDPRKRYRVSLRASVPAEALSKRHRVLLNGVEIGALNQVGDHLYTFAAPAQALVGRSVSALTLDSETIQPSAGDPRTLGVWVTYVRVDPEVGPVTPEPVALSGRMETEIDIDRLKTEWAKPVGKGWSVYFPGRRAQMAGYLEAVRYLCYHLSDLAPGARDAIAVDDAWDGVYATLMADKVLYYNPGPRDVPRTVILSPASLTAWPEVLAPTENTHQLTLAADSIVALNLTQPLPEMLLECEGFLDLGSLKPAEGAAFSPGQGPSHVLVPRGGSASTRFRCDADGSYRVHVRAVRRGLPADAVVLMDGRPLKPSASRPRPGMLTRCAGAVDLKKGVHSLTIKPRKGEDVRVDYVVLSADRTVAGYAFAVREPSARR